MRLFICGLLVLGSSLARAKDEGPIKPDELIPIVFENLDAPIGQNWGMLSAPGPCGTEKKAKPCTVRHFLAAALIAMAEEGFNSNQKKYLKGAPTKEAIEGQPGWSSAECEIRKKIDRPEYIKWLGQTGLYPKEVAGVVKALPLQDLWECTVGWGVDFGEMKWNQELRFFLDAQRKLVPRSFGIHWSP